MVREEGGRKAREVGEGRYEGRYGERVGGKKGREGREGREGR